MVVVLLLLVVMTSVCGGVFVPNMPNYWSDPKVYGVLVSEGVNGSFPQCKKAGINVCQFFLDTGGHHVSSLSAVLKLSSGEWHFHKGAHHPGKDDSCYTYVHGDTYGVMQDVTMVRKDAKGNLEGSWFVNKKIEGDPKHLLVMQVGFVEGKSNTLLRSRGKEEQKSSSSSDGIVVSGQVWVYGPAGVHWSSDVVCGPATATRHPEHTSNPWPEIRTVPAVDYAKLAKAEEERVAQLAKYREERRKKLEEDKRKAFDVPTLPGETPLQARWRQLKLGVLKKRQGPTEPGAVTLPPLAKNLAEEATKDLRTTSSISAVTVEPKVVPDDEGSGFGLTMIAGTLLVVLFLAASWVTIRVCFGQKKHKI